jgi:hypothetical protein
MFNLDNPKEKERYEYLLNEAVLLSQMGVTKLRVHLIEKESCSEAEVNYILANVQAQRNIEAYSDYKKAAFNAKSFTTFVIILYVLYRCVRAFAY